MDRRPLWLTLLLLSPLLTACDLPVDPDEMGVAVFSGTITWGPDRAPAVGAAVHIDLVGPGPCENHAPLDTARVAIRRDETLLTTRTGTDGLYRDVAEWMPLAHEGTACVSLVVVPEEVEPYTIPFSAEFRRRGRTPPFKVNQLSAWLGD